MLILSFLFAGKELLKFVKVKNIVFKQNEYLAYNGKFNRSMFNIKYRNYYQKRNLYK